MALLFVFTLILALIGLLGYLVWMDEQIYNPPRIPETDQERAVRDIKERIKVAEWQFKKLIGEQ